MQREKVNENKAVGKGTIPFPFSVKTVLEEVPDLDNMDLEALTAYRRELDEALKRLDASEPRNENSETYDVWAEEHEDLEDLIDEVQDRIEELL